MPKKKPTKAEFRSFCKKMIQEFTPLFNVEEYEIDQCFKEDEEDLDVDIVSSSTGSAASILIDSTYLNAEITFYKPAWESFLKGKVEELESIIVHEFCHFITEPLRDELIKWAPQQYKVHYMAIVERQTQRMCNVVRNMKRALTEETLNEISTDYLASIGDDTAKPSE